MIHGIRLNDKHSYYDFGLRTLSRNIGVPEKKRIIETVPYSNIVYDFSKLYGVQTYDERKLTYKFEFLENDKTTAQVKLDKLIEWLSYTGKSPLYDDFTFNYHFNAECTEISIKEDHEAYIVDVIFMAEPYKILNEIKKYNFPDLNGDGIVDATDASMISKAYADISSGREPELTPEQLILCDANMDGYIDATDASIVLSFYAECSAGSFENTPDGFNKFMGVLPEEVL